ncbi:MAG: RICIN domain-containing protein, partial [Actinomycetota bacterium]
MAPRTAPVRASQTPRPSQRPAFGRRRWSVAAGLVLTAALALLGTTVDPSPASAQTGTIRPVHSDLCLGVAGGSTASGAAIGQLPCDGSPSQTFTVTNLGGGYHRVQLAHSGKCVDIEGASTASLTPAIQWDCHGGPNQQFTVQLGAGTTTLVPRHSGLCLDIEGAVRTSGAALIQYTCTGGDNQRFAVGGGAVDPGRGRWSAPTTLPLVPVAGSNLGNGKVLLWSAYERFTFGGDRGRTQTVLYDPATGQSSLRQVSNTGHDMFCPGIANLADGRILVNGGSSAAETSIYDPVSDSWQDAADMNIPRGYQGTTLLSDGSAFTLGGSWSGGQGDKHAEVWTEGGGWRRLTGVLAEPFTANDPQGVYRGDNHLWLFAWTGNRVFHAGPTRAMHWIDTGGTGSVSGAGNRGNDGYAMNGNAVMYEPGQILTIGGGPAYQDTETTANATVIDLTGASVTSRAVAPMANRRGFHNSVVLPSGEVVVVGGQSYVEPFTDTTAVFAAELWDPDTETFRSLAPMAIPRTYHSFALLLADGRVLAGGGGLCGGCATNHPDVEILTPPYLLDADGDEAPRPAISSAPSSIDLNERFDVQASAGVTEFTLVRMSSATHSVNNDQRRIPLAFSGGGNGTYRLTAPADGGIAPPGNYFLFAIDGSGVPSVAAVVNLTTTVDPGGDGPGAIAGTVADESGAGVGGVAVDLFVANADGSRGQWLRQITTNTDGTYRFDLQPGCYVLTFIAPNGRTFTNGSRWYQPG